MSVVLKLNTGKAIELDDDEFSELKEMIREKEAFEDVKNKVINEKFFSPDLGGNAFSTKTGYCK